MLKTILLIFFSCFLFSVDAQYKRFVFSDSFNTIGLLPVNREFIQKNKIKYVDQFYLNAKRTDSNLFKKIVFDTAGNLIKEILFSRRKQGFVFDSLIYDSENRLAKFFIFSQNDIVASSSYEYSGDSVIKIFSTNYNSFTKRIDTSYTIEYINSDKQTQSVHVFDEKHNKKTVTHYTYTDQGLPASMELTDLSSPDSGGFAYQYEHTFSRKGQKMILWDTHTKNKFKREESLYNRLGQAIQCISYDTRSNIIHKYQYNPDGSLFEEVNEYIENTKKSSTRISHYYYKQ